MIIFLVTLKADTILKTILRYNLASFILTKGDLLAMYRFGSINYLNLLPFQTFLKQRVGNNSFQMALRYTKDVPSQINKRFKQKRVDAGFISSIESSRCKCTNLGIVSKGSVYSVLLIPGRYNIDTDSATSNQLAKVLNLEGQILIGDKALRYYLMYPDSNLIDLSKEWESRYNLPFVFARLCYNRHKRDITKLANEFASKRWKIPQYMLKRASRKSGIDTKDILWYLNHIQYKINWREKRALRLFLKLSQKHGFRP